MIISDQNSSNNCIPESIIIYLRSNIDTSMTFLDNDEKTFNLL